MLNLFSVPFLFFVLVKYSECCVDNDRSCASWVQSDRRSCESKDYIKDNCRKSCGTCGQYESKYDTRRLPYSLQTISQLVGHWRGEHTGKVRFPTIPTFKYSEDVEISIPEGANIQSLNYTATAWSSDKEDLHKESGYISVKPNTREVVLTTVMSNGFITVEEGPMSGNTVRFALKDIGRISFVRDEHVDNLVREWTVLGSKTLLARLSIHTLSHQMQEHTVIQYTKLNS